MHTVANTEQQTTYRSQQFLITAIFSGGKILNHRKISNYYTESNCWVATLQLNPQSLLEIS